ncbi:MAG TPA: hypothetical protein VFP10_12850 [Candidatus Eisenbacteria bacterium]|nr:hypothetical protein [Candidatus Eisenbacteria bacterium]
MKKRTYINYLLIGVLILVAGCSKKAPDTRAEEPGDPKHAAATVVPGSYEDWCGEHQVPESQCTRCDPTLIAAFQATNDWCAEHGLPESQCLICNPDLKIVRPPKPEGK